MRHTLPSTDDGRDDGSFRRVGGAIGAGVAGGLLLAVLTGRALRSYLYGLSPSDPLAYAAAIVLTAWMATVMPMRRALRVDPAVTLRHD